MKDDRDKLIPEQLSGYTWKLDGYAVKCPFPNIGHLICREAESAFQLMPEPPEKGQKNSRRCLPVSGGQRRRMGRASV